MSSFLNLLKLGLKVKNLNQNDIGIPQGYISA